MSAGSLLAFLSLLTFTFLPGLHQLSHSHSLVSTTATVSNQHCHHEGNGNCSSDVTSEDQPDHSNEFECELCDALSVTYLAQLQKLPELSFTQFPRIRSTNLPLFLQYSAAQDHPGRSPPTA
ncbi:MAG: hypothetical protein GWP41_08585 [Planctomycetia bacterium]|nr:hypothetical protein [Planctomycetia bacterium]NCG56437.1 hypothetical protein [Pseudomonadota bacterium]